MMKHSDRLILEFCAKDFQALKPLLGKIPKGTLYRAVRRLYALGYLEKVQHCYRTTDTGLRHLQDTELSVSQNFLEDIYPPIRKVPTLVHKALIVLIFAAIVARQYLEQNDRHLFFTCAGPTLAWKSSAAKFVCHALGLDPISHIVDCANEVGRSLTVRRDSRGEMVFKRKLLEAPFAGLDEFSSADPFLRKSLNLFLSGQRIISYENQRLKISPVPLVLLNPKEKPSLEESLGLSPPLIRRSLVVNLTNVPMPDLLKTGEAALIAARAHPPLELSPPQADCHIHNDRIVQLIKQVIRPHGLECLDLQAVVHLCSGMTGFLPEAGQAIRQVTHALGLLAETLDWTKVGWMDSVMSFSLDPKKKATEGPTPAASSSNSIAYQSTTSPAFSEKVPARVSLKTPRLPKEVGLPNLGISEDLRADLTWLAVEIHLPVEEILGQLVTFYKEWHSDHKNVLGRMKRILELSHELQQAHIEAETLENYLEMKAIFSRRGWCVEDSLQCLPLIDSLAMVRFPWTWSQLRKIFKVIFRIQNEGVSIGQLDDFLTTHQQWSRLGIKGSLAHRLAHALHTAGATGKYQDAIILHLIEIAEKQIDCDTLQNHYQDLKDKVQRLKERDHQMVKAQNQAKAQLSEIQSKMTELETQSQQLTQTNTAKAYQLQVLMGFSDFLMRRTTLHEPFWSHLESLLMWKRKGGHITGNPIGEDLAQELHYDILRFLTELYQETKPKK